MVTSMVISSQIKLRFVNFWENSSSFNPKRNLKILASDFSTIKSTATNLKFINQASSFTNNNFSSPDDERGIRNQNVLGTAISPQFILKHHESVVQLVYHRVRVFNANTHNNNNRDVSEIDDTLLHSIESLAKDDDV